MGKLTLNWAKLKPEVKQVWQLSLPAILTQITTIAMQYIDSAMVGALGAAASAAIGLVVAMTWLYNGVLARSDQCPEHFRALSFQRSFAQSSTANPVRR